MLSLMVPTSAARSDEILGQLSRSTVESRRRLTGLRDGSEAGVEFAVHGHENDEVGLKLADFTRVIIGAKLRSIRWPAFVPLLRSLTKGYTASATDDGDDQAHGGAPRPRLCPAARTPRRSEQCRREL